MIEFEKIRFKNFMSYGNSWTEFTFEKGINRISGANGSGKSTILSAIYYGLFGKPYNKVLLNHLLNCVNKTELAVEIYFSIRNENFKIERGMKPNRFYIFKKPNTKEAFTNEDIIPVDSASKTYQQVLEEDILNINENIFNQVIFKSANRDISFLPLKKSEKRKIIENIFDIEFFSSISKLAKSKLDVHEGNLQLSKKDIEYLDMIILQEQENLSKYMQINKQLLKEQNKRKESILAQIKTLEDSRPPIEEKISKIDTVISKIPIIEVKISEIKVARKAINSELVDTEVKIKSLLSKKEFYDGVCAGCEKLNQLFSVDEIKKLKKLREDLSKEIENLTSQIEEQQTKLAKANGLVHTKSTLLKDLAVIENNISSLTESLEDKDDQFIEIDDSKLKQYELELDENKNKYNESNRFKTHYNLIKLLFSDEGIKSFLIKKYLPHINKILNSYLQMFGSDILFYFDSEFNESIGSKYKEHFVYDSFSDGQKRRIDLAILFTFMEFCKIKNKKSNTNLLILDEVSSGLDPDGDNRLYSILKEIAIKEGKSILIVNHSTAIDPEKVDHLYQVELSRGFSKLTKVAN